MSELLPVVPNTGKSGPSRQEYSLVLVIHQTFFPAYCISKLIRNYEIFTADLLVCVSLGSKVYMETYRESERDIRC